MFNIAPVEIINGNNFSIENHPCSIGVPCPEGVVFSQKSLRLDFKGQSIPFDATTLANWSDGSIKWFLLDFQASVKANDKVLLQLVSERDVDNHSRHQAELVQVVISDVGGEYLVDTGIAQFVISKHKPGLFEQVVYDNNKLLSDTPTDVQLIDEQGNHATPVVIAIHFSDSANTLRKEVTIKGFFQSGRQKKLVDFSLKLTFYAGLSTVKCDFTLSNPRAAEHPGGIWDLGDKGSFFFKELSLKIQLAKVDDEYRSSIRLSPDAEWRLVEHGNLMLEQNSSGGKNWQSNNHINCKGEIPLVFKGFRYFEQGVQRISGDRAMPSVHITSAVGGITAHIVNFWQNFPKGIQTNKSSLWLKLFPRSNLSSYELQGGERKSHTFYLDFSNNKSSLDGYIDTISCRVSLDYYSATKTIPWLPRFHQDSVMQKLIDRGIRGEGNFFEKREMIDEFGWRNFGEIFADHEGLEYKGDDEFISHYNNQYDPLYGFFRQYLITGDSRWYDLLSALTQHIVDIDIYHTQEDRDEYNGGLFWHTHHYLNAFTCSHRTFSREHAADFLYGEIGGGPGAEHCYTTGLSYYYFITGDEVYKESALELVDWVGRVFNGSGTVIERLFLFKRKDLPLLKRLIGGETIQRYQYPFTRGTGNYITSLIDAYNLTQERHYVSTVEKVIYQSIHPLDNISLRNLQDIEANWSYLVYLQAICKYLDLKTGIKEIDAAYYYAKDSLLHYVDWMLENESPFLQNPEKLEYPNHTWTAQDLRKANIFYIASLYSENNKDMYLDTARFYVRYVEDTLKNEQTRYYSRILILLMQNDIQESSLDYDAVSLLVGSTDVKQYSNAPLYSISGILLSFLRDISSRLLKFSLSNEKRWLSFRVK